MIPVDREDKFVRHHEDDENQKTAQKKILSNITYSPSQNRKNVIADSPVCTYLHLAEVESSPNSRNLEAQLSHRSMGLNLSARDKQQSQQSSIQAISPGKHMLSKHSPYK